MINTFTPTDLMMVNAIVITGILILLTVSIGQETDTSLLSIIWKIIVAITAYPFAVSALVQLFKLTNKKEEKSSEASARSIMWMKFGFAYLLIMIFVIMIMQVYLFTLSS